MSLGDWLDDRLGTRRLVDAFFFRRLPKAVGWPHTLGSATLFLLLVQIVTGIFLSFYYVPSVEHAHGSVEYITKQIPFGAYVRGLHRWSASLVVIFAVLHLIRVFFMGAFKYPREASWVVGVLLLGIIFAFGFTGYLLPWDQKAYWATVVGTHIAEFAPGVGEIVGRLLRGGPDVGIRTLGRFYAFHVLFLPTILMLLVALHLFMVVRQGIAPPPVGRLAVIRKEEYWERYEESKAAGHIFLDHLVRDGLVALILLLFASWLALRYGAPLEDIADPATTTYVPRPEWYFYFLYELLWLFPGKWTVIATFWIPTLGFLFLLVLPFVDRGPARSPLRRPVASVVATGVLASILFLTYKGASAPAPPGRVSVDLAKFPPELQKGREVYEAQGCGACHMIRGEGGAAGPDLSRIGSIRDEDSLRRFIKDPQSVKPGSPMPDSKGLADESLKAIARYLASLK
jgi:ubiquinol-cytochrome c reductase cytochrome b subunit